MDRKPIFTGVSVFMEFQPFLDIVTSKTGKAPKRTGQGYMTCCPAHGDENPSLSIREGNDGRVLLHCFAGCQLQAICHALGLEMSDLFETDFTQKAAKRRTVYSYHDEQGKELYRKIRIEPGQKGNNKSFYSEHDDAHGQVVPNLKGCRRVLYRLPEVLKGIEEGKSIFLTEGEKDADKLSSYGLIATTAPESMKWSEEFTSLLKGADVVLLHDLDDTGEKRKKLLCNALSGHVKRLRVVDLPGLQFQPSHGPDVSDWLSQGHTIQELQQIVANTPDYGTSAAKGLRAVTLEEFLHMELPPKELILDPFLPCQGLGLLYAKRGVGKTHVALRIAYAVATGGTFLKWKAPKPRKVLYLDGEMPARSMQERLQRIALGEDLQLPDPSYLRLITPDLQAMPMPDLATAEGRAALEPFVQDSELIIIDNISTLFRSGDENEAESWQPVQDWALDLRRRGKSVLFVHHAAKAGQQRGTSKREDILDFVINLKVPQGHSMDQGAVFDVVFEKARHFTGKAASTFRAKLVEKEDGLWCWEIEGPQVNADIDRVVELLNAGESIRAIAKKMGRTRSQIETLKKKAQEEGLIS